jgi:hypothetical protein
MVGPAFSTLPGHGQVHRSFQTRLVSTAAVRMCAECSLCQEVLLPPWYLMPACCSVFSKLCLAG